MLEQPFVYLRKSQPGMNFTNNLRASFPSPDSKSAKYTVKLSVFFALSGSAGVKALHKILMKLKFFLFVPPKPTFHHYLLWFLVKSLTISLPWTDFKKSVQINQINYLFFFRLYATPSLDPFTHSFAQVQTSSRSHHSITSKMSWTSH